MNWRKHILIGALCLNCVLYLGTAAAIAVINTNHAEQELSQYAILASESLELEIRRSRRLTRDILAEHYNGIRSLKENLVWPEQSFLKMVSLGIVENGQLRPLSPLPHKPSLPVNSLQDTDYNLFYFDSQKKSYIALAFGEVHYGDDYQLAPNTFVASFEFPLQKWLNSLNVLNDVDVSIIERDEDMIPSSLYSTLESNELVQLMEQSPFKTEDKIISFYELGKKNEYEKTVFSITLNGTKHIVAPYILSKNKYARQVIYYSIPLPKFSIISLSSVTIAIASLFTTLVTILLVGVNLVKHLDKRQK